jgi:ribosomal protein L11 methyltransferase
LRARFLELAPDGFEEHEDASSVVLAAYGEAAERVAAEFPTARVEEVVPGWEDRWRDFHRPVRIGPLWVGPPWETAPPDAIAVSIDPGRAFGTGAHPTTRLSLALLLELPRGSVLDVGCGSGVLAIAAARLGLAPVVAVDVDEPAVEATRANAEINGVAVEAFRLDALADELPRTEIGLANIALEAVETLAPRLQVGWLVTSGYLAQDEPAITGFHRSARRELDGWAAELYVRS